MNFFLNKLLDCTGRRKSCAHRGLSFPSMEKTIFTYSFIKYTGQNISWVPRPSFEKVFIEKKQQQYLAFISFSKITLSLCSGFTSQKRLLIKVFATSYFSKICFRQQNTTFPIITMILPQLQGRDKDTAARGRGGVNNRGKGSAQGS